MKKALLAHGLRWLIPLAIYFLLALVLFPQWEGVLFPAWMGFCLGGSLHYQFGLRDKEKILDNVYGENWRRAAAVQAVREDFARRRQKAPMN